MEGIKIVKGPTYSDIGPHAGKIGITVSGYITEDELREIESGKASVMPHISKWDFNAKAEQS